MYHKWGVTSHHRGANTGCPERSSDREIPSEPIVNPSMKVNIVINIVTAFRKTVTQ